MSCCRWNTRVVPLLFIALQFLIKRAWPFGTRNFFRFASGRSSYRHEEQDTHAYDGPDCRWWARGSSHPAEIYHWTRRERQLTTTQLEGIRGFREKFGSAFPSAVTEMSHRSKVCDHLLIDVNQFLHMVVRKARTKKGDFDDRSLLLLMRELDSIVKFAAPRKSLVLAMDGPPPAAKLSTQRKRRQTTLDRTEAQMKLFQRLSKSKNKNRNSKRIQKVWKRKQKNWNLVMATLAITPGTKFMDQAASALLYWVWQRLQSRHSYLHELQIYISSSQVHGEGEVKLMEWLYRPESQIRPGDHVVMMGGDSDLVLQGLMVPPSLTHNVDVLMPNHGSYIGFCISEIVNSLTREYRLPIREENLMKIRTDIVLLFILTGNDYLPKLRGSSGFNSLFDLYLKLFRHWISIGRSHSAFLVDPHRLEFNREFSLAFFEQLESQKNISTFLSLGSVGGELGALGRLNNLKDMGIIPPNTRFETLVHEQEYTETELSLDGSCGSSREREANSGHIMNRTESLEMPIENDNSYVERVTVRLHVGKQYSEEYQVFELNRTLTRPRAEALRRVQHELAAVVIKDYLCLDSEDISIDEEDDVDDPFSNHFDLSEKESEIPAGPCVEKYAYGLLWNLQIYRDGTVSDFGFNYGKRLAPTAHDICNFLKEHRPIELFEHSNARPLSAGLSCVAALPLKVKELIPPPYSFLPDEVIDHLYSSCVDEEDSSFDIKKFSELSSFYMGLLGESKPKNHNVVKPSDNGWTVLRRLPVPSVFAKKPPAPFLGRLDKLREDPCISVTELACLDSSLSSRISTRIDSSAFSTEGEVPLTEIDVYADNVSSEDLLHKNYDESVHGGQEILRLDSKQLSTADGVSALQFLNILTDLGLVVRWKSEFDKAATHSVRITVQSHGTPMLEKDIEVVRNREFPYSQTAKHVKQEIATSVLEEMFTCTLSDYSAKELKALYLNSYIDQAVFNTKNTKINVTADGIDAISCLKQLKDVALLNAVSWSASNGCEILDVSLRQQTGITEHLSYKQQNGMEPPNAVSRQEIKHRLASEAIHDIFGPQAFNNTFESMRCFLLSEQESRNMTGQVTP